MWLGPSRVLKNPVKCFQWMGEGEPIYFVLQCPVRSETPARVLAELTGRVTSSSCPAQQRSSTSSQFPKQRTLELSHHTSPAEVQVPSSSSDHPHSQTFGTYISPRALRSQSLLPTIYIYTQRCSTKSPHGQTGEYKRQMDLGICCGHGHAPLRWPRSTGT